MKCWKKENKITWANNKLKQRIIIPRTNSLTNKYETRLYKNGKIRILVNYASKTESLKEANKYMKNHNKC